MLLNVNFFNFFFNHHFLLCFLYIWEKNWFIFLEFTNFPNCFKSNYQNRESSTLATIFRVMWRKWEKIRPFPTKNFCLVSNEKHCRGLGPVWKSRSLNFDDHVEMQSATSWKVGCPWVFERNIVFQDEGNNIKSKTNTLDLKLLFTSGKRCKMF